MKLFNLVLVLGVFAPVAVRADCDSVYSQAVANISVQTRHDVKYDYLWNEHCEANGEVKKSSVGIDFLGYGLTGSNATQKSQQFCKEHLQEQLRTTDTYSYERQSAVAATKSYNECRLLEQSGVHVSQAIQEPRSVVVRVDFDPSKVKLRFRSFVYDPKVATCTTSAFTGTPETITSVTKEAEVGPFAVVCERTPAQTSAGALKFDRFLGALDTSFGTYSVEMPTEEMFGYDLASTNKRAIAELTINRDTLQSKLDSLKVGVHLFQSGQDQTIPCEDRPGQPNTHWEGRTAELAKSMCGDRRYFVADTGLDHDGRMCGFHTYAMVCSNLEK